MLAKLCNYRKAETTLEVLGARKEIKRNKRNMAVSLLLIKPLSRKIQHLFEEVHLHEILT